MKVKELIARLQELGDEADILVEMLTKPGVYHEADIESVDGGVYNSPGAVAVINVKNSDCRMVCCGWTPGKLDSYPKARLANDRV